MSERRACRTLGHPRERLLGDVLGAVLISHEPAGEPAHGLGMVGDRLGVEGGHGFHCGVGLSVGFG